MGPYQGPLKPLRSLQGPLGRDIYVYIYIYIYICIWPYWDRDLALFSESWGPVYRKYFQPSASSFKYQDVRNQGTHLAQAWQHPTLTNQGIPHWLNRAHTRAQHSDKTQIQNNIWPAGGSKYACWVDLGFGIHIHFSHSCKKVDPDPDVVNS